MSGGNWRNRARCRGADPNAAFARTGSAELNLFIEEFCARCKVAAECLSYAMGFEEQLGYGATRAGVYGGLTGVERRGLAKFGRRVCRRCEQPFIPTDRKHLRCATCRRVNTPRSKGLGPGPVRRHGTRHGYQQHLKRRERACEACSAANALTKRLWKARRRGAAA